MLTAAHAVQKALLNRIYASTPGRKLRLVRAERHEWGSSERRRGAPCGSRNARHLGYRGPGAFGDPVLSAVVELHLAWGRKRCGATPLQGPADLLGEPSAATNNERATPRPCGAEVSAEEKPNILEPNAEA